VTDFSSLIFFACGSRGIHPWTLCCLGYQRNLVLERWLSRRLKEVSILSSLCL